MHTSTENPARVEPIQLGAAGDAPVETVRPDWNRSVVGLAVRALVISAIVLGLGSLRQCWRERREAKAAAHPAPKVASVEKSGTGGLIRPGLHAPAKGEEPERPYCRGYLLRGRQARVVMSDGNVFSEVDRELEAVRSTAVVISGQRVPVLSRWQPGPAAGGGSRVPAASAAEVAGAKGEGAKYGGSWEDPDNEGVRYLRGRDGVHLGP